MNKLKSTLIPCTTQEYHNIVEPTLRAYGYKPERGYQWSDECKGVAVFSDSTWMATVLFFDDGKVMTVADLQAYHPLYTYATVHAHHVGDAVAILRDIFTIEVDGNEIKLPKRYQESAAAMLFDALIPAVFSDEPCKSKQS